MLRFRRSCRRSCLHPKILADVEHCIGDVAALHRKEIVPSAVVRTDAFFHLNGNSPLKHDIGIDTGGLTHFYFTKRVPKVL